ncbi:glucose-regulated protein 94 [Polychytrium aggregatum]|uniref:glucose-regulated protein 94 n=1 Tax=Polychytrium aggregatum TaxID=110093 RepID=UPI0022FDE45B|nr:glucose-regulated protein 94 [Polychytrium aggregatum]KAI9205260.1 glucose-regulated protein 94 [Polychytrium aggregatum]
MAAADPAAQSRFPTALSHRGMALPPPMPTAFIPPRLASPSSTLHRLSGPCMQMKLRWFSLLFAVLALALCVAADASVPVTDAPVASGNELPSDFVPLVDVDPKKGERFQFETEVGRLMHLIINSLYKTKEIFLRELISNASDAIDKIRFLALTDKDALSTNPDLKITVLANPQDGTITITDTGVGMTKEDLKKNLGTIAKSGTSEFLASLESNKTSDVGLIGQFGVGFYSVFLVADRVTVVSKHNSDKQYVWQSSVASDFTIFEDPRGDTLGRGTQITIHLKEDAVEYLQEDRLKGLIKQYSEFINFPIYVWSTKVEKEEVPVEDDESASTEENEDGVEDAPSESTPKTKTVEHVSHDWELVNQNRPLWTRSPRQVSEEEYKDFYRAFTKGYDEPIGWTHFSAEGDLEFRSILYVPGKAPSNFLQGPSDATLFKNIKLFVRRVFITDELMDFMPKYLQFLKGLVDSDDMPLNVSRETLQQSSILKLIRKKLIAKALDLFKSMTKDEEQYSRFWKEFGIAIKFGILEEDQTNRVKLANLLRFHTSFKEGETAKMTSLDQYIARMKKGQTQILCVTGASMDEAVNSPFTEKLVARGYEVLYMTDPLDEYVIQHLTKYSGHSFHNIVKDGVKFGDEDEDSKEEEEALIEKFEPLTSWFSRILEKTIEKTVISNKLTKSPAAITAPTYGVSGTMQRLMDAHSNSAENRYTNFYGNQRKILEINPDHPIIQNLLAKVQEDPEDPKLKETAQVLYETTLLRSGYSLKDWVSFTQRIENVVRSNLGVSLDAQATVKIRPAPEAETEKKQGSAEEVFDDDESPKGHDEL